MLASTESSTSLHVGIDFGQQRLDVCVLRADGAVLDAHQRFANSLSGYQAAKAYLLAMWHAHGAQGLRVAGEATGYYWLPFFLQLAAEPAFQPDTHPLELFVHNPRHVAWFKRGLGADDKSDVVDPYYIAEHLRTRPPQRLFAWSPQLDWLGLRLYTRLRFHLLQALVREKNYTQAYLFLQHSAYARLAPFADLFGATSRRILASAPESALAVSTLAAQPLPELAERLSALSGHHFPHPEANAARLQRVQAESFPLPAALVTPVQRVLQTTLGGVDFLEAQVQQVEAWIAQEVAAHHPEVACLDSIPGIGLAFAAGISAEIGDLQRYFAGPKWDERRKRWRAKTLRDVEDAVARFAGLWWPHRDSGRFVAEERHLSKHGNRYLRYYLVQAADRLRHHLADYEAFYQRKFREAPKHRHKRALVLTARKSVGLYVGLLHRREAYHAAEGRATTAA